MPIPTDPSNAIQSYFPIQELSDAPIYIYLVKIGPIKQAGPLKGVFLQYKVDDVVIAQYQFDREARSEEHTSELSHLNLVCRLLLEKKNKETLSKSTTFE